ncbi:PREDICTED: ATP-dependent Clp protease ATP-binding subunit CLPT2, chloroplastic [Tarenaya hassleriana]|uniref:ATP-dependent Clp protease ATP-binding subunit CLPT2, chloroplastic n=1 Tax=Tarenaya hassleriana TaxID=28532 RepID=UPI00053C5C05|nr:PREDICTED: ATP-dependent Clp protease ATP-binding subunit CLPT2, chloroplastic [Tarenaya hassleriana]
MAAHSLCKFSSANPMIFQMNSISIQNQSSSMCCFPSRNPPKALTNPWLGVDSSLSLSSSITALTVHSRSRRRISSAVVSSLPTVKPDSVGSDAKVPKWSWRAIKAFAMAELEARKLRYPTTGTEALLMGILVEGTSFTSKYLRANGIMLLNVREETVKLLGKSDRYCFSPEHPPLTEDAQRTLDWAVNQKIKSGGNGEITTTHILLGIWSEAESPGHKILANLGFNDEKSKELESFISEPGYLDE